MTKSAMPFAKLSSQSRPEMIVEKIRSSIADGDLAEGQQLVEASVAASFGVSRGTVREATQRLVQEGILTAIPHRGVFVTEFSDDEVVDIYNARRAIELSAALALTTAAGNTTTLQDLRREHESMAEAVNRADMADFTTADQRFHEKLVASLKNRRLLRMSATFLVETRLCLARLEDKYSLPQQAVSEHLDIIEAIEAGATEAVVNSVNRHMDEAIMILTGRSSSAD